MVFTKEELKAIEAFEKEHGNCYKGSRKPLNFLIRQNWCSGIEINVYITCDCCGKEKDVTNYEYWRYDR